MKLETNAFPAEQIPSPLSCITDVMVLVQMINGNNLTFNELSDKLFYKILQASEGSVQIDMEFDVQSTAFIPGTVSLNFCRFLW